MGSDSRTCLVAPALGASPSPLPTTQTGSPRPAPGPPFCGEGRGSFCTTKPTSAWSILLHPTSLLWPVSPSALLLLSHPSLCSSPPPHPSVLPPLTPGPGPRGPPPHHRPFTPLAVLILFRGLPRSTPVT